MQNITGYVFEDLDKSGIKEINEPGIKGVAISDQANVVLTNEAGSFSIIKKGYGIILFPCLMGKVIPIIPVFSPISFSIGIIPSKIST